MRQQALTVEFLILFYGNGVSERTDKQIRKTESVGGLIRIPYESWDGVDASHAEMSAFGG